MSQGDLTEKKKRNTILDHSELYYKKDKRLEFARQQWKVLQRDNKINYPLFPSAVVDEIIDEVIKNWITMEMFCSGKLLDKGPPLSSGSNILITGVKGVGKTTLMYGLSKIIQENSEAVLAYYVDYEQDPSRPKPSSYLKITPPFTQSAYDTWAKTKMKGIFLFADEVQHLYTNDVNDVQIVQEILCIGKSPFAMGIISGSSSDVKALVHKECVDDDRYKKYPNLNHTVYSERHLCPVRKHADLKTTIATLYDKSFDDAQISELFRKTGGIGRYISTYVNDSFTPSMLPNIVAGTEEDPKLKILVHNLYVMNMDNLDANTIFAQKQLSNSNIQNLNIKISQKSLKKWRDAGFLYYDMSSPSYEFLIPEHFWILKAHFDASVTKLQLLAFETTLRGWEGYGSAGQVLEPLIIRRLIEKKIRPFENCRYDELEIALTKPDPLDLSKKIAFTVKQDKGIDGAICYPPEDGNSKIIIFQIKAGQLNKRIMKGTESSADASMYFTAMCKKAARGWKELQKILRVSNPCTNFILDAFVLCTTKYLHTDVTEVSDVKIDNKDVRFMFVAHETFVDIFERELKDLRVI